VTGERSRVGVGLAVLNLATSSAASGSWSFRKCVRRGPVADLDGIPGRRPRLAVYRERTAGLELIPPDGKGIYMTSLKAAGNLGRTMERQPVPGIYVTKFEYHS
jgi:hypothetical protein